MAEKYPETKQTFEAMKNLGAESKFVSFKKLSSLKFIVIILENAN